MIVLQTAFIISQCLAKKPTIPPFKTMITVPGSRTDYLPKNQFHVTYKTAYETAALDGRHETIWAEMLVNTLIPTINLANFPAISSISCAIESGKLEIVFGESIADAKRALKQWSEFPDMAIFVPHDSSCPGDEVTLLSISNIASGDVGSSLVMNADLISAERVFDTYELDISSRDRGGFSFPLNANYNSTTDRAEKERIHIINRADTKIDCVNCYTSGRANFSLKIHGWFFIFGFGSYEVKLNGNLDANLDINVLLSNTTGNHHAKLRKLFSIALYHFGVPGFFALTPQFIVRYGLGYYSESSFDATCGFDISHEFAFALQSEKIQDLPTLDSSSGQPSFRPHKPSANGVLNLEPHLAPGINLDLQVLTEHLSLQLYLDSVINARLNFGDQSVCANKEMNLHISRENNLELMLSDTLTPSRTVWQLYGSGKSDIQCPFCDKCPASAT